VWYEGVGIKIENLLTNERRKVQKQLILFAPTNILLIRLCPQPPALYTVGKLRLSAFSMC
jgi:hypothetical protein